MKTAVVLRAALAASVIAATACKPAESKGSSSDPGPAGTGVAVDKGPSVPTGGGASDSSFNLQVQPPDGAKAGAECVAHVTVTPGSGYHVNQDFPTKLVITPPDGVQVAKAEQHKEDAAAFDTTKLQFDVKLTAAKAGTYKVAGTLKFAVCTDTSCDPKKREIAFEVAAN